MSEKKWAAEQEKMYHKFDEEEEHDDRLCSTMIDEDGILSASPL